MATFFHSKNSEFRVDDSGGTLRLISGVESVSLSQGTDPVEVTGIGDPSKSYINGFIDVSLSVSGVWTSDANDGDLVLSGIVGGSAGTYEFDPDKTVTTGIMYSGEAICTSYNIDSAVGDKVTWTAEFLGTTTAARTAPV